ncbi:MAG: Do family serine endopeptidase [Halieaceae bacterium]|jgi:serine protease Do|nr:Do family serine endopeptidase [Halieaceae bacterium]
MILNLAKSAAALAFCALLLVPAARAELPDFKPLVRNNTPAVVKILTEYAPGMQNPHGADMPEIPEYLRRFFEFRGEPPQQRPRQAMGSGFVISEDGYIVTNNHVVEGADTVIVRFTDRQEYEAEIVGLDERSDLALLKVDAEGLPTLSFAEPDALEVGEWVVAIGSPFGLDYSVTAGIVSAKGRSLPTENGENYVPFIQTDVAINPGNSGGPLFNLKGEVVGVNSQIFTRTGGSIGLSFAIPVSVVSNVVAQLRENGDVSRGWLGVSIQDVDKVLAESLGLERPQGALIVQVQPGGPADRGGLESGDVIISFDDKEILTSSDLPHVVGLVPPESKASVVLVRDGKRKTMRIKVGRLDSDDQPSVAATAETATGTGVRLGLVVEDITDSLRSRWNISGGVVVSEVVPDSPAAEAEVRPGDVITLLAGKPVTSVDSFLRIVEGLQPGKSVPVRLIRRGNPLFLGLKPE